LAIEFYAKEIHIEIYSIHILLLLISQILLILYYMNLNKIIHLEMWAATLKLINLYGTIIVVT